METSDIFNGIAVIIDDEIGEETAYINKLIEQIEDKNIPCVKYTALPNEDSIDNLQGISFLLLDWLILETDIRDFLTEGVNINSTLQRELTNANIQFIKRLKEKCFIPIFIFTNEDTSEIISKLEMNNLYKSDKSNFIFVKNKSELLDGELFNEIYSWIQETPSIYVLKEWEKEYEKAKNRLFWDFYNMSPSWPKILWDNFSSDSVNMSGALGEVISRNLCTRMTPFSFREDYLLDDISNDDKDEVRRVLEGERFIKEDGLHKDSIAAGDVFKLKGKIYLNIRPDCDCVPNRNDEHSTIDDVNLYLLKGNRLANDKEGDCFNEKYGHFNEQDNNSIVFSMIECKSYVFQFKDLNIKNWSELKNKRIGRLLPPYITRIQQRYAFYLQRQGLPRTPEVAVYKSDSCIKPSEQSDIIRTVVPENIEDIR